MDKKTFPEFVHSENVHRFFEEYPWLKCYVDETRVNLVSVGPVNRSCFMTIVNLDGYHHCGLHVYFLGKNGEKLGKVLEEKIVLPPNCSWFRRFFTRKIRVHEYESVKMALRRIDPVKNPVSFILSVEISRRTGFRTVSIYTCECGDPSIQQTSVRLGILGDSDFKKSEKQKSA